MFMRICSRRSFASALLGLGLFSSLASARAQLVTVRVENLSPTNGTYITPVWFGFHNGTFDLYDQGAPAAPFLERIAEDGNVGPLNADFAASGAGGHQGTLFGPVIPQIAPGESTSMTFALHGADPLSRYFSYASMIVPSNDAFIANGNPLVHRIFADDGTFLGANFVVVGSQILDAGTEVNDEIPMNTAFFGQMMPDTGVNENGVVHAHPGFLPPGSGGILDDPRFANADFTAQGYQIAHITVTAVPEPGFVALLLGAALPLSGLLSRKRRK